MEQDKITSKIHYQSNKINVRSIQPFVIKTVGGKGRQQTYVCVLQTIEEHNLPESTNVSAWSGEHERLGLNQEEQETFSTFVKILIIILPNNQL